MIWHQRARAAWHQTHPAVKYGGIAVGLFVIYKLWDHYG
jgi:hypothetical protein